MRTLRTGWDLDGVGFNFADSLRRYLKSIKAHKQYRLGRGETSCWDFYHDWGMDLDTFLQVCHDGADAGHVFRGPVRPGFVDAVNAVKAMGHEIVIITDRSFGKTPEVSEAATYDWLAEHKVPYDELHFSPDKTVVPTDIFIEDKLQNYDALTAAGTECWLINRPWNRLNDDRKRIRYMHQYPGKVALMAFRENEKAAI